jgi:hypothetical protein
LPGATRNDETLSSELAQAESNTLAITATAVAR